MKIYCRNYECEFIEFLDEPVKPERSKFYTPLVEPELCKGICSKKFCGFIYQNIVDLTLKHKLAVCSQGEVETCERKDCTWVNNGACVRESILVEKVNRSVPLWRCSNRSDLAITGHMDWSRLGRQKDMF